MCSSVWPADLNTESCFTLENHGIPKANHKNIFSSNRPKDECPGGITHNDGTNGGGLPRLKAGFADA